MENARPDYCFTRLSLVFLFFAFAVSCGQNKPEETSADDLTVKTFEVKDSSGNVLGWGYDIYMNKKKVIHQPIIPAIEGLKQFKNEKEAFTVGAFSISKMKRVNNHLPSISLKELDSLGISK